MGGASMQVSFVPSDLSAVDASELVNVKIGGATFPLYTHSYLNYGLEQAQVLFGQHLAATKAAHNPCYQRGLHFPKQPRSHDVADAPTAHSLPGAGAFDQCSAAVEVLFDRAANGKAGHVCTGEKRHCAFNGVYMPKIGMAKIQCRDGS
jgi:hypothetical protein